MFGARLEMAQRYADLLASAGLERGLIGPREAPRLWERHLLNCAVLGRLVPTGATVADLGSGAGLPGIPVALARPDLRVTLVEPLLRRSTFLVEVVAELNLTHVEVVRGRAEDLHGERQFDVVTSRALAPLPRLVAWSMPLVREGGLLLAMKGANVEQELESAAEELRRLAGSSPDVVHIGEPELLLPTTVLRVEAPRSPQLPWAPQRRPSRRGRRTKGSAGGE